MMCASDSKAAVSAAGKGAVLVYRAYICDAYPWHAFEKAVAAEAVALQFARGVVCPARGTQLVSSKERMKRTKFILAWRVVSAVQIGESFAQADTVELYREEV